MWALPLTPSHGSIHPGTGDKGTIGVGTLAVVGLGAVVVPHGHGRVVLAVPGTVAPATAVLPFTFGPDFVTPGAHH